MATDPTWVDVPSESAEAAESADSGKGLSALAFQPTGLTRGALVLVQEIFGVNANLRLTAQAFADAGFHVLVPDLFWRVEPRLDLDPGDPAHRERAMQCNAAYDDESGLADLRATVALLKKRAGTQRVSSVGYCLGGRLSFALGQQGAVTAAVAYYGVALQRYFDGPHRSPTLAHLAQEDTLCPPAAQAAILERARDCPAIEAVVHAGVGHAFARLGSPAYVAETAQAAQARTQAFLSRWG